MVSRVLALALLLVLLLDPWAVLAAGFWLSFGAVALLFYIGAGRLAAAALAVVTGAARNGRCTLGMIPALLALFQQFSLVSPLANAVAIPRGEPAGDAAGACWARCRSRIRCFGWPMG